MTDTELQLALERYREGNVGMRGAAEIADVPIAKVMREANERKIRSNYDEDDLEGDVNALR